MKKLLWFAFVGLLCAWPVGVSAQGIEAGDQTVSVFLGGAAPVNESGIKVEAFNSSEELEWGDGAVSYGAQYMYALTPYFSLGAEFNGNNFGEAEYSVYSILGSDQWESKMNVYNFMAAGRLTANPQANTRFYVPFGLGLASAKGTITKTSRDASGFDSDDISGTTTSFAYYVGLGLESNVNENWILGGELRYQGFTFDNGKYGVEELSGKENLGFVSLMLKLSYKF